MNQIDSTLTKRHARRLGMLFEVACDMHNDPKAFDKARLAAGLYVKNELICVGVNSRKTSPLQKQFGKNDEAICNHAEIATIRRALNRMSDDELRDAKTTLYIARSRRTKSGGVLVHGGAAPCKGCQEAIKAYKINRIVYTTDSMDPAHKPFIVQTMEYID